MVSCLLIALFISALLLLLFMQSDDRGQTIFAIFAAFFLAVLAAHYLSPAPYPLVAWLLPLLLAIFLYVLGSMTRAGATPQDWTIAPIYARSLPIDWATFGIGGGLLGYWFSARFHEAKRLEDREADSDGQDD